MEEGQAFDSHWKKTMWACAALQAREVTACLGSQNVPFRNQGLYDWEQKKQREHFKPGLLEMEPLPKHTTTLFSNHGDTRVEEEGIWLTEELTFVGEVGAGSETNKERESERLYFAEFFHLKVSKRISVYFAKSNICFPDPPDKKLQRGNLFLFKFNQFNVTRTIYCLLSCTSGGPFG